MNVNIRNFGHEISIPLPAYPKDKLFPIFDRRLLTASFSALALKSFHFYIFGLSEFTRLVVKSYSKRKKKLSLSNRVVCCKV